MVRWSHGHCSSLKPWRQRRSTPQSARNAESFGSSSIARSRQQPSLRRNADTVNAHGAVILLSSMVSIGQLLTLRNSRTGEEVLCRVAYLSPYQSEKREVGVDFALDFGASPFLHLIGQLRVLVRKAALPGPAVRRANPRSRNRVSLRVQEATPQEFSPSKRTSRMGKESILWAVSLPSVADILGTFYATY